MVGGAIVGGGRFDFGRIGQVQLLHLFSLSQRYSAAQRVFHRGMMWEWTVTPTPTFFASEGLIASPGYFSMGTPIRLPHSVQEPS